MTITEPPAPVFATLSIDPPHQTVSEGETASVTVSLPWPLAKDLPFSWSTEEGTADAGADYRDTRSAATAIAAGETSTTLAIPIIDDTDLETDENFTIRLISHGLPSEVVLGADRATVVITDDDDAVLSIGSAAQTVAEGEAATVAVSLSSPMPSDVTFSWQTVDGSATSEDDLEAAEDGIATIAAGGTSVTLTIQTVDDDVVEGDESFIVRLSASSLPDRSVLGATEASVTIADNDRAVLSVGPSFQTVSEGETVHFTIAISAPVDRDLAVSWSAVGGTATGGTDFIAASGTVNFAARDTRSKDISIQTVADRTIEEEETFSVVLETLNAPSAGVALDPPAEVTIADVNERPVADAGDDSTVDPGELVTTSGHVSLAPDRRRPSFHLGHRFRAAPVHRARPTRSRDLLPGGQRRHLGERAG